MPSAELMRKRIDTAQDLHSVVRMMKAIAGASIRQYERAVHSLKRYTRTLEMGFQVLVRERSAELAWGTSEEELPTGDRRIGVVVFGSDQGLCGPFNEPVLDLTLDRVHHMSPEAQPPVILTFGARLASRLADAGYHPDHTFPVPNTVSGVTMVAEQALVLLERIRASDGVSRVMLYYNRPEPPSGYRSIERQLIPLDGEWLRSLARRPWPGRSLPMYTMKRHRLFAALIRQYLFVALYQACAESLAAENAARLQAMHAAEKNIEDKLTELRNQYHRERQEKITDELLEITAAVQQLSLQQADLD